jgi:hypothetical protein
MAVPTVNVTCTVTNQTGAVVAGATVTAQLTGIDVYGTNYIFPSIQSFVTDVNGLVTMPLFPNALGARRTAYQFIAIDPVTGRALINITAVVPNQNIDLSVLDAINKLPAYAPPLTQPFSNVLSAMASLNPVADQMMYFSGPSTVLLASLTSFGRSLVAAANAAAAATVLGLGTGNSPTFAGLTANGAINGIGYVAGGGAPVNPGGLGANRWVIDNLAGSTRLFSYGPNGATNGIFQLNSQRSDGTNAFDVMTTSVAGVVTFPLNVITPVVTANLVNTTSGPLQFSSATGVVSCNSDNTTIFGDAAHRWISGFFTSIDSGSTGSLSLGTNNGTVGFSVAHVASAVNSWQAKPAATTGAPILLLQGTDTNIGGVITSKGTGNVDIFTANVANRQLSILHTAGNQCPTITGSNSANSQIGTTGGGLDFTSPTIRFTGIGTTANAANATLNAVGSNDLLRSTSSKRYKTEIEVLSRDEALTLLRKLNPITYASMSEHDDPYLRHSGFIAEEVFDINPLFVSLSKSATGKSRPESVQYERLTVPLVAGWQDHEARLAALEARIH